MIWLEGKYERKLDDGVLRIQQGTWFIFMRGWWEYERNHVFYHIHPNLHYDPTLLMGGVTRVYQKKYDGWREYERKNVFYHIPLYPNPHGGNMRENIKVSENMREKLCYVIFLSLHVLCHIPPPWGWGKWGNMIENIFSLILSHTLMFPQCSWGCGGGEYEREHWHHHEDGVHRECESKYVLGVGGIW